MASPKTKLWPLEPHSRGKHLVLKNYLDAWFPILGSQHGRILFIDGFAGPGEYKDHEEGSPLIALRALKDHKARQIIKGEVVFNFIESEPDRVQHLRTLVEAWKPGLPASCIVEVIEGRFDETMAKVLDRLDADAKHLAPAFVMIDPFGVSGTPMDVVRRILRNPKAEIYASFMYEAINRFKTAPEFEHHLTDLFGGDAWRAGIGISDPIARRDFFYGLYIQQLRQAGATHVVHFDLYEQNRLVYAIFFATKSWVGADRMKQAIWKVAPFGEFAFHGTHSRQLTLGLQTVDYEPLKKVLRDEFEGKGWVRIERVLEFVGSDKTDYHTGHVKKGALVPMETAGQIEIDGTTRKKKRSYPKGTKLRFK
ncbi:MAG: three-Cys-motif partner protein TcmP [Deltaproteobacteria bacterium]|nr:three-Cys-motif partner protein TcmP [Deltaproteobacteria bacterium]MBI3387154.1 three-Cys-motif partner protein TcmP [Deltaproteobacteria bacterium]